jgi:hypothetical protein
MGGACSVRVNIQGKNLLSGRLRNTGNRVWSVHWCNFVNIVPNIVHSIKSSPHVKLSPFLSVMNGTRRDQNVRWLEVLEYNDFVLCTVWRNNRNIT